MSCTKDFSSKQEKQIADYLGWETVVCSGAMAAIPGDIKSDMWLGECKTHTEKDSKIKFYSSVWSKIVEEANSQFKFPILFVDDGSQKIERTWCMIPDSLAANYGYQLKNIPYRLGVSISFDGYDFKKLYKEIFDEGIKVIYSAKWGNYNIAILPLDLFKEIFIGD